MTFLNRGDLTASGFRLDVASRSVTAYDVGLALVRHLGLLMVDTVSITALTFVAEPHRGGRDVAGHVPPEDRLIELSHPIEDGMVTYPGLPGPRITAHLSREASYAPGTQFEIGRIDMVGNTGTYLDAPGTVSRAAPTLPACR